MNLKAVSLAAALIVVSAVARANAAQLSATLPNASPPPLDPGLPASSWKDAASFALTWDVVHRRAARDETQVRAMSDGQYIFVRFDATQHGPVVISQHGDDLIAGGSNGNQGSLSWSNDDAVWVDLWPTGPGGFQYQFESNPGGAHNEASSENTAFAPHWESRGAVHDGGYTVTMAIPLRVVHGLHAGTWRMQFLRYVRETGAEYVWSFEGTQNDADDSSRAGTVTISVVTAKVGVPKPRVGVYALGSLATSRAGGSTSRIGADISIPVSSTAAFYSTIHPDFSNVELDQQSISPSVYQRVFSEVRPFFTQGGPYYNNFDCDVCNGYRTTLYTPAIPTPREGFAFEGKAGQFGLAAFDAVGKDRSDIASALNYVSTDTKWRASLQHVVADVGRGPGAIVDVANQAGVAWNSKKFLSGYATFATDSGSLVPDTKKAQWFDIGGGWLNPNFAAFASVRKVGEFFNPYDGFDSHPDIAGYGAYMVRIWSFTGGSKLQSAGISGFLDRYHDSRFGQAQTDQSLQLDVLTKSAWDLQLSSGSDYWRFYQPLYPGFPANALTPISQNAGASLTYHSGLINNVGNFPAHGTSATPTQLQWYTGRYGLGRLDTWYRTSTMRVGTRGFLTIAADSTSQWFGTLRDATGRGISDNIQWFDSLSYAYQITPSSSLAIGVRRETGTPPQPNGGGTCPTLACSNVSIAYHLRLRDYEIYTAYGDPNTLTTVPQAIFKIIFYAGGEKGT